MGRKSTLDMMPDTVRTALNELLSDRSLTQKEIVERLNAVLKEMGEPPVMTERIVNRYARNFEDIMAKKRESNAVMKTWLAQVGEIPDGDFGRGIVEIVRTLAFDMSLVAHATELSPEELPGSVKMLKELAFAVEKIEKAASENEKRAAQIRKAALDEATQAATTAAKAEGVSETGIARIREALGMIN